jgi:hypothetical protein
MAVPVGYVLTSQAGVEAHGYQNSEFEPPSCEARAQTIYFPRGQASVDEPVRTFDGLATGTIETDEECRAVYLQRTEKAFTTATVLLRVMVATTVDPVWAEVAICKGTPGPGANVKLTTLGYADATSAFTSTGVKVVSVALGANCPAGTHVWLAWACKKKDQQFNSPPDYIQSGMFQGAKTTQPSTMAADTQFQIEPEALEPAWACVGMG